MSFQGSFIPDRVPDLGFDPETSRARGHRVVDMPADYVASASQVGAMPVLPRVDPDAFNAAIRKRIVESDEFYIVQSKRHTSARCSNACAGKARLSGIATRDEDSPRVAVLWRGLPRQCVRSGRYGFMVFGLVTFMLVSAAQEGAPALVFERTLISAESIYEAASAFDVNNDGVIDIFSGEYWWEGPDFAKKHKVCTIKREDDYYDDFSNYPMDVNGDGWTDIVTGGWWGMTVAWRENPKSPDAEWPTHVIKETGNVERCCFYDIDGDGDVEIVPNTKGVWIFKLVRDANGKGTGQFRETQILEDGAGHGVGYGDINGDGHVDLILSHGWLEASADPYTGKWELHKDFTFGASSCPILTYDVNKDGKNDIIVGMAHDYGLQWWEQKVDAHGARSFERHNIEPDRSQFHEIQLVDIDNDGELELVTGKRFRAHAFNDPGSLDPLGLYYYEINGGNFERHTLDYGDYRTHSGAGIYLWVEDVDKNGWKDIVAPGKDGLYLFKNMGPAK